MATQSVALTIGSRDRSARLHLPSALVLPRLTSLLPARRVQRHPWPHIAGLTLADPDYDQPAPVDAILDADVYGALLREGLRSGPSGAPSAQATALGWVLMGQASTSSEVRNRSGVSLFHLSASWAEVDRALQRFWQLEELSKEPAASPENLHCESQFAATHARDSRGRYLVRLPRRNDPGVCLGYNRGEALGMLTSLERRLTRNPTLREQYVSFMAEYQLLGHMAVIPAPEIHRPGARRLLSTAPRCLQRIGLDQQDTRGLQRVVPAKAAIRALGDSVALALFQVRLYDGHRKDVPSDLGTPKGHGLAAHPVLAEDEGSIFPLGAEALRSHSYVDDILAGGHTLEEAMETRRQTEAILAAGRFDLSKWAANIPKLCPVEKSNDKLFYDRDGVSTLGVLWSPPDNSFALRVVSTLNSGICTKRTVLSDVARFFDPLSWAAPVLIFGKVFIQDL
ncbi:uncharacterized protein LOC118645356 [Monomorium pharaonis]|uniref:uncharacterized protein LOC118645356 n=1 Tax=Monomorium pharaonis TaxID=307658 RepID=UPI00174747AF|nr:uncharacterized protein LOC118645356 [Monomorium pharaonis]